jgi:hypothetical protein
VIQKTELTEEERTKRLKQSIELGELDEVNRLKRIDYWKHVIDGDIKEQRL